jgi:diadenosine tetraphosphate (Ap4A) HIT family hydrolase
MRLTREQAVEAITREMRGASCLMCALLAGKPMVLAQTEHAVALLPRYGLVRGHAIVATRAHRTRFDEVETAAWQSVSRLALEVARITERELAPARCYVASLGTARDDIPMTCSHLHQHVVPVHDADARPAEVLTWAHGVERLSDDDGRLLLEQLGPAVRAALNG